MRNHARSGLAQSAFFRAPKHLSGWRIRTVEKYIEHKAVMEEIPEKARDDPNAVRVDPGATGAIVWTFSKVGTFEFA